MKNSLSEQSQELNQHEEVKSIKNTLSQSTTKEINSTNEHPADRRPGEKFSV